MVIHWNCPPLSPAARGDLLAGLDIGFLDCCLYYSGLRKEQHAIEHSTQINASAETVWTHITEVDIASFHHPAYFSLLGISKPLRAEIDEPGVGGARTAFFSNQRRFTQKITEWRPFERYAFTFQADPGFRVAYILDLSDGPFQMKAGAYRITPGQNGVRLSLTSRYELSGIVGLCLHVPVRLVLSLFQRYLLRGIKTNAERSAGAISA